MNCSFTTTFRCRLWQPHTLTLALVAIASCLVVGCGDGNGDSADSEPVPPPRAVQPNLATALTIRSELQDSGGADPEQAGGEALAEPTGRATMRGSFKLEGSIPASRPLGNITPECTASGATFVTRDLEVDPATNGIGNIFVFVEKLPAEWLHEGALEPAAQEVVFDQKNCKFISRGFAMQTAQVLKIANSDPFGHNTNMSPLANPAFNQTVPSSGLTYQPTKPEKMPFPVKCSIHPWMSAYMLFRDDPYFAVTQADGTFEIPNLPAGVPLTFRVWQEKVGWLSDVNPSSPTPLAGKGFKKGRFSITLDPDDASSSNVLDVTVDASVFQ